MSVPLPSLLLAIGSAVLGSAFVATDAALGSLSSARIAALLEQDELPYKHALVRFQREPWGMRSTYLVGRVLCAAVTAVLLTEVVEGIVGGWLGTLLAIVGTVAIYAPISDLATSVARQNPDAWGLRLATLLRPLEVLFFPLAAPLAIMTKALLARFSERETTDPMVATAEVEYLVDEVERSGVVGAEPAEIIRNVLEFEDRRAKDVMVPRARVEAIDISTPLAEVRRLVANSGHCATRCSKASSTTSSACSSPRTCSARSTPRTTSCRPRARVTRAPRAIDARSSTSSARTSSSSRSSRSS
ncbi:MAG: DUF21 domain-containing protein [Polyangiaceae bacterium]|nr:DUF21 domain-containing protein [Polyangiaceae bacterium]